MKHSLTSRAMRLATILAATAMLAGCSKENAPEKAIEPEPYDKEVTLYVTSQNKVLDVGSSLTYPDCTGTPESPAWFTVGVRLEDKAGIKRDTAWVLDGTKYIRKELSDKPVTGIEVIANANYDAAHPKGASLNDLMKIDYPKPGGLGYLTMDMAEYFQTLGQLNWKDGWSFRLAAKTPPTKENEGAFFVNPVSPKDYRGVTLKLTLEDGTVIETVPEDWGPIPTE